MSTRDIHRMALEFYTIGDIKALKCLLVLSNVLEDKYAARMCWGLHHRLATESLDNMTRVTQESGADYMGENFSVEDITV